MSDQFKPPPFNYCDYRCDRCDEQANCRVYKDSQERLLEHYRKGEDPYDPEVFMNDLKEIFGRTERMIRKLAQEQGVDLEQGDEEPPEVDPTEYVVYCLAYKYFEKANAFIKLLEKSGMPEGVRNAYDDLVWYHSLIAAKCGRLVAGFADDYRDEEFTNAEEQGTIKVIQKGIILSKQALETMLNELPEQMYVVAELLETLKQLEKQLDIDIRQKA